MRQLLLEWDVTQPQTLDNFVVGRNQELAELIAQFSHATDLNLDTRFVMIWGESGCGKSHLLHALKEQTSALYLTADSAASDFHFSENYHLYLLDDCEAFSPEVQIAAFGLLDVFSFPYVSPCSFIVSLILLTYAANSPLLDPYM